ncbi:helix-turn-helix domain-containing protein [Amycolatopsis sp. NPDC051758]|uniref:helix-turn-helix domain-containing protein n=1 Tax=Amycolatopsis sp. NPDC051758 TaxID=3363935 RepID=UPI0037AC4C70
MTSSLGEHLRNARDRQQLQQKDVGDAVGVSQGLVSNWEKGKKTPSFEQLRALAGVLDLDVTALIDRQYDICDDVERAILQSTRLNRKEQDALLASYGIFADRESAGKAAFFRTKLPRTNERGEADRSDDEPA